MPSVLLADDLAPADTAGLEPERVVAIATERGGPTSHTAIIARQLGIPCVVAVPGLDGVATGAYVLVDGSAGEVALEPERGHAAERVAAARRERAAVDAWRGPAATSDGRSVDVLANVQDGAGARKAAATGAAGVGLFRTELCFLDAETEPTVAEQAQIYGEVFAAFAERGEGSKVVLRTLDAGSDKPLKFATAPDEPNPALGVRGLRIAWAQPGILERQLDAVALAAEQTGTSPWVMAPMVATQAEAAGFAAQVRERGLTPGVMIEVPAAALHADRILREVDFLSIGTNDLSQYTLAADRLSADLAHLTDPWQPALLQLVALPPPRAPPQASRSASAGRPLLTRCSAASWSGWASPRCRARRPPSPRSGRAWPRSTSRPARRPPGPPWPPPTRQRPAPPPARSSSAEPGGRALRPPSALPGGAWALRAPSALPGGLA